MTNKDETREKRLLAALKIITEDDNSTPDILFYAHVLLINSLQQGIWGKDVADSFAMLITRQWIAKTRFGAMLRTPRFTIPEIQNACNSKAKGFQKASQILLVVSNAVSVNLHQEIKKQLFDLANN